MKLPVSYIYSHDSITVGQDGPTHQPVEQLTMLRTIPNFDVYRPADAKELVGAWSSIFNNNKPNALILSRGDVPILSNSLATEVDKGAYIVRKEQERLYSVIIATGSEVNIAVKIANAKAVCPLGINFFTGVFLLYELPNINNEFII